MLSLYKLILPFILLGYYAAAQGSSASDQTIYISGSFKNGYKPSDSIYLHVWDKILTEQNCYSTDHKTYAGKIDHMGNFRFKLSGYKDIVYMSLGKNFLRGSLIEMLRLNLAEPGDSIHITIQENCRETFRKIVADNGDTICPDGLEYSFSGRGYEKYECLSLIKKAAQKEVNSQTLLVEVEPDFLSELNKHIYKKYQKFKGGTETQNNILKQYRERIGNRVFMLMQVDILAAQQEQVYKILNNSLPMILNQDKKAMDEFNDHYTLFSEGLLNYVNDETLLKSVNYASFLLSKLSFESNYKYHVPVESLINKLYMGPCREKLLVNYMLDNFYRLPDGIKKLEAMVPDIHDVFFKKEILRIIQNQQSNVDLSGFSLINTAKKMVKLSDFKGKVVFIDFWFTGCSGCMNYYKTILSGVEENYIDNKDVVFVTVSIDTDHEKWLKSIEGGKYTSDKAVNLNTGAFGNRHPLIQKLRISSYPRPMLLDRNGKIFNNNYSDLRLSVQGVSEIIDRALAQK